MTVWLDADGDLLADKMTLKPDRLRWLLIFLISAGFVAIATWIGPSDPALFYGAGGFFLLCALVAATQMIGIGSSLTLDREGFTCRTLLRTFRRKWVDCSPFITTRTPGQAMAGFSTSEDERSHPRLSGASRAIIGASAALPETYGLALDELVDLLNRFRARALEDQSA